MENIDFSQKKIKIWSNVYLMTFDDIQRPYAWSTKVTGATYLLN